MTWRRVLEKGVRGNGGAQPSTASIDRAKRGERFRGLGGTWAPAALLTVQVPPAKPKVGTCECMRISVVNCVLGALWIFLLRGSETYIWAIPLPLSTRLHSTISETLAYNSHQFFLESSSRSWTSIEVARVCMSIPSLCIHPLLLWDRSRSHNGLAVRPALYSQLHQLLPA